jgi:hypothetical protein
VNKPMFSTIEKNREKEVLRVTKDPLNKYVDFNKDNGVFYDNLYLSDMKFVIKIPFRDSREEREIHNIKIEKFTLTDSIYLFNYV